MIILDENISLTDNDIIRWNNKINTNIGIKPKYNIGNFVDISLYFIEQLPNPNDLYNPFSRGVTSPNDPFSRGYHMNDHTKPSVSSVGKMKPIIEPIIEHKLDFSIPRDDIETFDDILDNVFKLNVMSKVCFDDDKQNLEKPIDPIQSKSINRVEHTLNGKDYIRFECVFKGSLGSVMMCDKFISTATAIFNKMMTMEYKIGTVVSTKDDKGKNYLVKNYRFANNEIMYILIEILDSSNIIVSYGDECAFRASDVCGSRDNKIEQILDKRVKD